MYNFTPFLNANEIDSIVHNLAARIYIDYKDDHVIALIRSLKKLDPRTVKICALLDEQERYAVDLKVDYADYKVECGFLIGYGLDYDEKNRNLADIYTLKYKYRNSATFNSGGGRNR
ncbi:hypothetical protein QUF90_03935 [Desulfococcaceae bacterium HSG9]|nr:hypothetical protein [Desulfococcaceae bacterium HSG9]